MSNAKIGFLFGAGVELDFGLPSGGEYTRQTMCVKREEMFEALSEFYKDRVEENYSDPYKKEFHFKRNSIVFKAIINKALEETSEEKYEDILEIIRKKEHDEKNTLEDVEKNKLNEFYDKIFNYMTLDKSKADETEEEKCYKKLIENFSYHGAMERKFSTITDPKNQGNTMFWSVINYMWSCYFSILLPILDKIIVVNDCGYRRNKYKYVLENLEYVSERVFEDKIFKSFNETNYYAELKKFKPTVVMTTNYTPFVMKTECKNTIYLAGKLNQFEIPNKFKIIELKKETNISDNDLVFPFMMTQAPIKPIVNPVQLKEYSNALKHLEVIKYLVIVGYSLSRADDHINAIINQYLENGSYVIYCEYNNKDNGEFDEKTVKDRVCKSLRFEETERIIIIQNNGIDGIYNRINNVIKSKNTENKNTESENLVLS